MIKASNTWKAWSSASTRLSMEEGVMEEENAEVDEEGEGGCVEEEEEEEEEGEGSNKDEEASAKVVGGLKVKSCLPLLLQGE